MSKPIKLSMLLVALAIAAIGAVARPARAETPQEQARRLASEGLAMFQSGDYNGAVGRFLAADKLAPAPLNDFNVGLCYDRLGNREQAIHYYRSYLQRDPGSRNRAQVEASINRLDGEMRAEAARKAAEAEAARKAAEAEAARKAAEDAAARKAAEDAAARKAAEDAARQPPPPPPPDGGAGADVAAGGAAAGGITATADDRGAVQSTGDPDLDRVAAVDVGKLRAERGLYGAPPAAAGTAGTAGGPPPPPPGEGGGPVADTGGKKSKPAYKQWWFWVVVGVSAVILIDIASTDSNRNAAQSGAVLFHF